MRVAPVPAAGRHYIEGYGPGRFRIGGADHLGAVLVLRTRTLAWPVSDLTQVTPESLVPVTEGGDTTVLLLGCGARMALVPPAVRDALRAAGVVVEPMDTGSACRTYNVLLSEDRLVAAALLPLP